MTGRLFTPLEAAFVLYHMVEDMRDEQEREIQRDKHQFGMNLLIQHAPERARTLILADERAGAEAEEPDDEQFFIEDPWFSDLRPLHARLGISPEQLQRTFPAH